MNKGKTITERLVISNTFKVNHPTQVQSVLKELGIPSIVNFENGSMKIAGDFDYTGGFDDYEILQLVTKIGCIPIATFFHSVQTPQEALSEALFPVTNNNEYVAETSNTILTAGNMKGTDIYSYLQDELLPQEEISLVLVNTCNDNTMIVERLHINNITYDWDIEE